MLTFEDRCVDLRLADRGGARVQGRVGHLTPSGGPVEDRPVQAFPAVVPRDIPDLQQLHHDLVVRDLRVHLPHFRRSVIDVSTFED